MITQSALKELMQYCPETGVFTNIKARQKAPVGSVAGSLYKSTGYWYIQIRGKRYRAHRLAWLYTHGEFPPDQLDHKNRIRSDNRICNLRPATNAENLKNQSRPKNNTSGHSGVVWCKASQRWLAQITLNYKKIHRGSFTSIEDAVAARKAGELRYHTP